MFKQIPNMHLASYMDTGLFGKKQGIHTVENKQVKHGLSILQLLGVQLPKKVAMIHCRGHLKGDAEVMKRNNKADTAATTPHTSKARSIQLLPNIHKRKI